MNFGGGGCCWIWVLVVLGVVFKWVDMVGFGIVVVYYFRWVVLCALFSLHVRYLFCVQCIFCILVCEVVLNESHLYLDVFLFGWLFLSDVLWAMFCESCGYWLVVLHNFFVVVCFMVLLLFFLL